MFLSISSKIMGHKFYQWLSWPKIIFKIIVLAIRFLKSIPDIIFDFLWKKSQSLIKIKNCKKHICWAPKVDDCLPTEFLPYLKTSKTIL